MENESKLPLGICRHCVAALELSLTDINEIIEDEEVNESDKHQLEYLSEVVSDTMATITNMVMREMGEEDFLAEHIDLEKLESYDESYDIMNDEME